jgi:uncharacterized protein YggU (UPF0235/DUF167 family)
MSLAEVTFPVRVRPGASRTAVGGSYAGPLGPAIVVAVGAPALDGRANTATLTALAKALGLGRRQVLLRSGERGRDKLITVTDPPPGLPERLRALLEGAPTDGARAKGSG